MAGARPYRAPVFPSHLRDLRGQVSVHAVRDRVDGSPVFRVSHVSRGGDITFTSLPIAEQSQADAAARVLAEYFGAEEIKLDP